MLRTALRILAPLSVLAAVPHLVVGPRVGVFVGAHLEPIVPPLLLW